jgi:PPK2 family polyphosphate:nucleotide phosphotransferase
MPNQPTVVKGRIKLKDFATDYCADFTKEKAKPLTKNYQKKIGKLQELLYADSRRAVLLVFQGLDASGKDGAIRNVLHDVNPAGVSTANFKVPSEVERAHDYLWRVHQAVPRHGWIGVFNRSHYEAVAVERVLGLVSREQCVQRYAQIVDFERMLTENGVIILKFFLHLGREEQAKRFQERLEIPHKRWKFSSADLETRSKWNEYMAAYEDAINETSTSHARWHVIPADRNWYRNYAIARVVVNAMEDLDLKWPRPKEDLSKIRIK